MVASVNTLTTVFGASSPFIVADSKQTSAPQKTETTLLTPKKDASRLADIANAFAPAADISALSSQTTSVLLTEQAREKPLILQNPNPPLDTSSLGNLDFYKELLTTPLTPDSSNATKNKNSFVKDTLESGNYGPPPQSSGDFAAADSSVKNTFDFAAQKQDTVKTDQQSFADKPSFISAIASYQQASPALTGGTTASVNISV